MEQLLQIRESIIKFYKRFELIILFVLKLLAGMYVFSLINGIGLWRPEFAKLFTKPLDFPFFMLLSLLFAVLPPTPANCLVILALLVQISLSLEVAVFVFLLLLCVLAFYGRVSPKKSYLVLVMIVAYRFNLQYAVAIFAGLYLGLTSMIPIAIGTCISSFIPLFANLADTVRTPEKIDLMELPTTFLELYKTIFESMSTYLDWIVPAFVFAMVVLAVYAITRLAIPYAKEIAILSGGVIMIVGFMIAGSVTGLGPSAGSVVLGVILCMLLVAFLRLFDSLLDHQRVERVQFEDEDNYYYVKVVPKIASKRHAIAAAAATVAARASALPDAVPRGSARTRVSEVPNGVARADGPVRRPSLGPIDPERRPPLGPIDPERRPAAERPRADRPVVDPERRPAADRPRAARPVTDPERRAAAERSRMDGPILEKPSFDPEPAAAVRRLVSERPAPSHMETDRPVRRAVPERKPAPAPDAEDESKPEADETK